MGMGNRLSHSAYHGHVSWTLRFARRPQAAALLAAAGALAMLLLALRARRRSSALASGEAPRFAQLQLEPGKVFFQSPSGFSLALRDLRPILPGHLVVVPRRPVERLAELSKEETVDLFETACRVQALARPHYGATAFNWAMKDGRGAGQPVPHLHLHVVPRKAHDLPENDLVYGLLDRWTPIEGQDNLPPAIGILADDQRQPRTEEEMAAEAAGYATRAGAGAQQLPKEDVKFGRFNLKPSQVFYASSSGLSLAFVNLKPIVPGHILVISRRVVPTLGELTVEELHDLWHTVREVQALVQECHSAPCSTLGVQDGKDAGQSVPHVHVHVLPLGRAAAARL